MNLSRRHLFALSALFLLILSAGCSDRDPSGLETARATIDPLVFDDSLSEDTYWQPFFETNYVAMAMDSVFAYQGFAPDGARSLKFNIAPEGSALGAYTGGVLTSSGSRDLTDFNALTFYARSDSHVTLNEVGFGNDNTGTSLYGAGRSNIPLTGEWAFIVVPIPAPAKIISERGLFLLAESLEPAYPNGYNIWVDEIRYAQLSNIELFRANLPSSSQQYFIGATVSLAGTQTIFQVDGAFAPVSHSPNYFDYVSSDPSVATINNGVIEIVGPGTASVTATVGTDSIPVNGIVTLTGFLSPPEAAAAPTVPAGDVISMFSDVYQDVPVDTWRTDWSQAGPVEDLAVQGNLTKMYTSLIYAGIDFQTQMIDAAEMTHFHLDVFAPAGTNFKIKLVSFPPDVEGVVQTPDLILDATTTPAFNAGAWSYLEIPLADFTLPEGFDWANLGQMVISTNDSRLLLLDNVYFHK